MTRLIHEDIGRQGRQQRDGDDGEAGSDVDQEAGIITVHDTHFLLALLLGYMIRAAKQGRHELPEQLEVGQ
jgi:hypothetical protein